MTVLTVVAEALVQRMLAINLQQLGLLVASEEDVAKACNALNSIVPDLIIVDAPASAGYQHAFAERLYTAAQARGIPVITLVGPGSQVDKSRNAVIVAKPFAPRALLTAVRSVLPEDSPGLRDAQLRAGGIVLNPLTHRVSHGQTELHFHSREFRLLALMMRHADCVFSRDQLLDQVWGADAFVGGRAVDVNIRRLRAKLEPHGLANRIETIRNEGYRFRG